MYREMPISQLTCLSKNALVQKSDMYELEGTLVFIGQLYLCTIQLNEIQYECFY